MRGLVQGIGFRPFVHGLAQQHALSGFVRNDGGAVVIEVEGESSHLALFEETLPVAAPSLARIEAIDSETIEAIGSQGFSIEESRSSESAVAISPDLATCDACLSELFDPGDRRHGYPLLNCTHCGPRFTIVRSVPYDRASTTMAGFGLCEACRGEYEDPADRRFHAQPTACAECGPAVSALTVRGERLPGDPIATAAAWLRAGKVVAVKGLGGFHLAVDATREASVALLRRRKEREEKPFAVMVQSLERAAELAELTPAERALLTSPARPVVLVRPRTGNPLAAGVAPEQAAVGLMLPYTPLHQLLLRAVQRPLVLTSGNVSDEPIAFRDEDALLRLGGIAEGFLLHDRPIHMRCDDSVARVVNGRPLVLRRSRGFAPAPLALPQPLGEETLAVGGQLKSAFALGLSGRAILGHHLGDLDGLEAYEAFRQAIPHYEALHGAKVRRVVHDLHPDYVSTRYAEERAEREGIERIGVQHHHAHFASCLAENGYAGRALGIVFDGAGYGNDGTVWGGEFLLGDAAEVERVAHLPRVRMPGGTQAMREPWRMALSYLLDAGVDVERLGRRWPAAFPQVLAALQRGINSPWTTSAGRLFDAAAWILGGRDRISFEGQAAMWLEGLATRSEVDVGWDVPGTRGLLARMVAETERGLPLPDIARRFHLSLAARVTSSAVTLASLHGVDTVALSGGVFANALLTSTICRQLERTGLRVLRHSFVPPNDGGLCLGQLAVVAARDSR